MGGMETAVRGLIAQLLGGGAAVTCVCPYASPFTSALGELGCEVYITPVTDDPPWRSIQMTLEVARLHGCDLLHAHMPRAHALAGLVGCLAHLPVVATVHGMNVTSHELGICRTTGSHLITVCQEAFGQALAMGVPPERVAMIANGVDLVRFQPGPRDGAFRAALGIPEGAPLVGFVGRLEHEKGPDHFVRAVAHALLSRPELHAVMVGDGAMGDDLAALAAQLGLGGRLHMAGQREVDAQVYGALDLLALTSRSEGMPLVLLEAMACAVPAVAIAVGGVAEVVENEATGIIMGPGDWEGVGVKIGRLLGQPERLRKMGQAARRRAQERYDLRVSALRTAELFRQLSRPEPALELGDAQIS
jgi:glycosyltransferase involved in cell wall biosynthesis